MQRNANIEQTSEMNKDFFVISQRVKQIFAVYCKYAKNSKKSSFLQIFLVSLQKCSPLSVPPNELLHFGWNIGKAFGKKRIHTATFIKNVFAHALRDIEVSTIERKMSHTESECRIKLDGEIA